MTASAVKKNTTEQSNKEEEDFILNREIINVFSDKVIFKQKILIR